MRKKVILEAFKKRRKQVKEDNQITIQQALELYDKSDELVKAGKLSKTDIKYIDGIFKVSDLKKAGFKFININKFFTLSDSMYVGLLENSLKYIKDNIIDLDEVATLFYATEKIKSKYKAIAYFDYLNFKGSFGVGSDFINYWTSVPKPELFDLVSEGKEVFDVREFVDEYDSIEELRKRYSQVFSDEFFKEAKEIYKEYADTEDYYDTIDREWRRSRGV